MHYYGEWPAKYFEQIDAIAYKIGMFIAKWGRIRVLQTKEKFGTVRVYCHFGFDSIHGLVWPKHDWIHKWWPYGFDLWISHKVHKIIWLQRLFTQYQEWIYKLAYKKATKKYPHLKPEILDCADYGKLLRKIGN